MATIGIFDSGAGGLSVFREIYRILPKADYVYWSDNAYCPYGEKSRTFIVDRARKITDFLLGEGADIIVVACNTATAAAINVLRSEYSDPEHPETADRVLSLTSGHHDHVMFIGMEPAIKPAAALTRTGVVGVLATAGTLGGQKYHCTRDRFASGVKVVEHVGKGFVELVERGITSGPEAENTVRASLQPLLDAGADVIVLGCTHYPFLMDVIRKVAGPGVSVIDPAPAVARHLCDVMTSEGLLQASIAESGKLASSGSTAPVDAVRTSSCADAPHVRLFSSGSPETLHKLYSSLFAYDPASSLGKL